MNILMTTKVLKSASQRSVFWWLSRTATVLLMLTIAFAGYMTWRMNYTPANVDTSTSQQTSNGLYHVSYTPSSTPVPINQLHTWTLKLTTRDGQPVTDARITVDGDMPQHGHGLPTQPEVTRELGEGIYLVEGVKFQMGGWWVMDFAIEASGQSDTVRFNLLLTR